MSLLIRLKRTLARHRRNRFARRLNRWLVELHEGYENRDYDHDRNGEQHTLQVLAAVLDARTIFDVGANVGQWTQMAASLFPGAHIHSFEPVPGTYVKLAAACGGRPNLTPNAVALSDQAGTATIYCPPGASHLATCVGGTLESFHRLQPESTQIATITGDAYCAQNGIEFIDLLKLDVEGYEHRVLRGLAQRLQAGSIKVIQFEYGYVNVATRFLLKDFYELLEPLGMRIGKIYPGYVEFRDYRYEHEDFLGPNFLAVHRSLEPVIAALAK